MATKQKWIDAIPQWLWEKLTTEERTLLYRCEKAIEDEAKHES